MRNRNLLIKLGMGLLFIGILALSFALFLYSCAPDVAFLRSVNPAKTAMMSYFENRALLHHKTYKASYSFVPLSRISPNLQHAVILAEDSHFYRHHGFVWSEIKRAWNYNLKKGELVRGNSSISQQLAKNLFLEPTKSMVRKMMEAIITVKLEKELSKNRILELYLNVVEWGNGIYGAEAAANIYYKKSASELSAEEAVRLASILSSPKKKKVDDNSPALIRRRLGIVKMLFTEGFIDQEAFNVLTQKLSKNY